MTRYETAARNAIRHQLVKPVTLFTVACWAEEAARQMGKKNDLYNSLYDYSKLLPAGWHTAWLKNRDGSSDSLLYVVPNGFQSAPSNDLLLGAGTLVVTSGPDM